jgi:adenylate kinase family enzyme
VKKVSIVSTCSGNGKTTLGRQLASILEVPFVELDALVHGPNWTETPDDELVRVLEPVLAGDGWVIDGNYSAKFGNLVFAHADTIVWLDLPVHVWLPRLLRRTTRRILRREELWNSNRESLKDAIGGKDALIPFAFRMHRQRRRTYPARLAAFPTARLRTPAEVEAFVSCAGGP